MRHLCEWDACMGLELTSREEGITAGGEGGGGVDLYVLTRFLYMSGTITERQHMSTALPCLPSCPSKGRVLSPSVAT